MRAQSLPFVAACLLVACSGEEAAENTAVGSKAMASHSTLNTYISQSIEIDQLGTQPPEDANLFVGADPGDGSASVQKPAGGPTTWIDWENLGNDLANHRVLDLDNERGKDPTAFGRSNECVSTAQVLSKMDLTYIASANNANFAYFAVQRSANNGDAAYYWIFTKNAPRLLPGAGPCRPSEEQLVYDISGPVNGQGGDILVGGHFKPNGTPFVQVYRATRSETGVDAVSAVDYKSNLWQLDPAGSAASAVNTTITEPGAFGSAGVKSLVNGKLDTELFAEAAIPMTVFTGGSRACGVTYYGSVITRSSGSGGTSPDLKDLAGPALFNFGDVTATATLTPSCWLSYGYSVSATGPDGQPLTNASCTWTFSNGETSTSCNGVMATNVGAGSHSATVEITDPSSSCSKTVQVVAVDVYDPLQVSASMTANCQNGFTYDGAVSGGSGVGRSYKWVFSGKGAVTPSDDTALSGSATVNPAGLEYSGTLTVTEPRDGLNCTASGSAKATPLAPLQVSLSLTAAPQQCPSMGTDAVRYTALPSGGNGVYNINWTKLGCSGSLCTIDPSDSVFCAQETLQATVTDTSGLCSGAASEVESYTKSTTVTASDN